MANDVHALTDAIATEWSGKCQDCAMCCVYYFQHPGMVPLLSSELARLPQDIVVLDNNQNRWYNPATGDYEASEASLRGVTSSRKCNRDDGYACSALVQIESKLSCSVYDERPDSCIDFEPGSPACLKVRSWADLEDKRDVWLKGVHSHLYENGKMPLAQRERLRLKLPKAAEAMDRADAEAIEYQRNVAAALNAPLTYFTGNA